MTPPPKTNRIPDRSVVTPFAKIQLAASKRAEAATSKRKKVPPNTDPNRFKCFNM